jgi:hypothetical protein
LYIKALDVAMGMKRMGRMLKEDDGELRQGCRQHPRSRAIRRTNEAEH